MLRLAVALVICTAATGCEVAEPAAEQPVARTATAARHVGAPVRGLAATLAGVQAQMRTTALEWQDEPVLAEMTFTLGGGSLAAATLTYLAGGSDRLLMVSGDDGGLGQQRVTLSTFGLEPVPDEALADVPALPDGVQEPAALAAGAARACGLTATEVRYETGAPWRWDGETWSTPPAWRAVAIAGEAFAVLDPVTGDATC